MNSILQQLYNGELFPAENYNLRLEEYKTKMKEYFRNHEEFVNELKKLNPPLDKRFLQIMDERMETFPLENAEVFIHGFCLGAQIIIEVFSTHPHE